MLLKSDGNMYLPTYSSKTRYTTELLDPSLQSYEHYRLHLMSLFLKIGRWEHYTFKNVDIGIISYQHSTKNGLEV